MSGKRGNDEHPEDYFLVGTFQWQNGVQVPVLPKEIMEEAGANYLLPPWSGPWNNIS
jgi:hypothetical protein